MTAFLFILSISFSCSASLFAKAGTVSAVGATIGQLVLSPWVWASGLCYFATFVTYFALLRHVPLSLAQPVITAGVTALTAISAVLIFRETLTGVAIIGILLIVIGIVLLSTKIA